LTRYFDLIELCAP